MVRFDIEGSQNVEVSKKIKCEKSLIWQLERMEQYTDTHKANLNRSKERREVECLKVIFPALFRSIEEQDLIAGRLDFLPIGFGTVTSIGGVGHYCVFNKLRAFQREIEKEGKEYSDRVEELYRYWENQDLKVLYCKEILTETTIGRFIDVEYPMIATARLSGMMLDYHLLLELGIPGLKERIQKKINADPENEFYQTCLECLEIVTESAEALKNRALQQMEQLPETNQKRRQELQRIADGLEYLKDHKPVTFHQALQLLWLYALLAGVINYGRLDDFLGPYLAADLETGRLSEEEAYRYLKSLWTMIENRRTTVNGRVIVGGKGRRYPKEADQFMRIAMKVCINVKYVEPQFTLRLEKDTPEDVWEDVMEALGKGATYPTLYNDEVNISAVSYGMRVDEETAKRYVPFGCTEFVIWGQSTGTPNICINLLKILTIYMNQGIDPMDGQFKLGELKPKKLEGIKSFEEFFAGYKEVLDYYMDLAAEAQFQSYRIMNEHVSFLFTSILMDDCLERGKALLDGGVRYLGGTCETYGNINTSDSLWAIKKLVFEEKKYTLTEMEQAVLKNFEGCEKLRKDCLDCEKYGNDLDNVDAMANEVYEYVAKGIRDRGIEKGMQYFLIVISNNSLNTEWGIRTAASPDGRTAGMYMNPANNPQGGADRNGPTAMLNSLAKFNPKYHAGSVQNIKFSRSFFKKNKELIRVMFQTYFEKGGCHLMVTVVDKGELEDAMIHPEAHRDLIVRVAGYSAVFVDLDRSVQEELLSRSLHGEEDM